MSRPMNVCLENEYNNTVFFKTKFYGGADTAKYARGFNFGLFKTTNHSQSLRDMV